MSEKGVVCFNDGCVFMKDRQCNNFPKGCYEVRKPQSERDDIIKKIENNDYDTLGKLADLILMQEGVPKIESVTCTTATLNKIIRSKVKK